MRWAWRAAAIPSVAVAVFAPTLWSRFAADDFLLRYAAIHSHLSSLLSSDPLAFQGGGNFFRPVWFAYDDVLTSLSGNPALYHALNVAVYAGVAVEVWLLLRTIVQPVPAAMAAALFAVYPRHTEAVAWYAGSMDLLPALFGLAAMLAALRAEGRLPRLAAVALLAAAAAGSKENAYLLAPLFVVVQVARAEPLSRKGAKTVWAPAAAIAAGEVAAWIWRLAAFHKIGGYANHPWTPFRVVAAAGSDVLAAVSPPQIALLTNRAWIALPVTMCVLVLGLGGAVLARRPERRRVVLGGLLFAVIGLLPTLNVAINLDTAGNERFLFLPSVGLAVALAGALPESPGPRMLISSLALGAIAALFLGVSIDASVNWQRGSVLASSVVSQVTRLTRANREVVLLSMPGAYLNADVLGPGLDAAVSLQGGRARIVWCSLVSVRAIRAGQIAFVESGLSTYIGRTSGDARFRFPLSGANAPAPLTPDCSYTPGPSGPRLGSATSVTVRATPALHPARLAYFDGKNVIALQGRQAGAGLRR